MKNNFAISDTNQAKGIALLMLLWHHLFLNTTNDYSTIDVMGVDVVNWLAGLFKWCVGIFVFLSGYGLYKSQMAKPRKIKQFYFSHLSSLLLNYWFIWLVFVPIGMFVFGRTFSDVFTSNVLFNSIMNFFGLQYFFLEDGYNPTWWFMSCIIALYLLFPFLKVLMEKLDVYFVLFIGVFSLFSIKISFLGIQPYAPIEEYLLTFIIGMFVAKRNLLEKIKEQKTNLIIKLAILFFILFFSIVVRQFLNSKALILTDGIMTFTLLEILFLMKIKSRLLILLGKHSYNIFLFHTFIFYYFFQKFIYSFYNPILIFLVLTVISLIISVVLEWVKEHIYFYELNGKMKKVRFKKDTCF